MTDKPLKAGDAVLAVDVQNDFCPGGALAVPDGDGYVPIAKAYSGLSDQEIGRLDRWIRRNTVEKFGPVRSVRPHHVFEIAFEGIQPSPRHKSGIALRFPRIARWRQDLTPDQADSLTQVKELLDAYGS